MNFGITADATTKPPIEVNFGLNRTVATVVPSVGGNDNHPKGEAVNMFAGFQIDHLAEQQLTTKVVDVELSISTQFASGAAAMAISGHPEAVNQIVGINGGWDANGQCIAGYLHGLSDTERDTKQAALLAEAQKLAEDARLSPPKTTPILMNNGDYVDVRKSLAVKYCS